MAKEAIIWGNQALESLPAAAAPTSSASSSSSSCSSRHPPPPPPSPPLTSPPPVLPAPPSGSPHGRGRGGVEGGAATSLEEISSRGQQQQIQQQQQQQRGSGRVGGGAPANGNAPPPSSSSSEAQVAAWGASLVRWLTGQFSTVLRRAERCRTELRGDSEPAAATATGTSGPSSQATPGAETTAVDGRDAAESLASAASGSGRPATAQHTTLTPALAGGGEFGAPSGPALSPGKSSMLVSTAGRGSSGLAEEGRGHGAAPAAVAVSARDIVVRAALAMAKESAASEVLGMWEPARRGYEKVRNRGDAS